MQAQYSLGGHKLNLAVLDFVAAFGTVLAIVTAPLYAPISDPTSMLKVSAFIMNAGLVFMLMVQGGLSATRRNWGAVTLVALGWLVLLLRYPPLREHGAWPCLLGALATVALTLHLRRSQNKPAQSLGLGSSHGS